MHFTYFLKPLKSHQIDQKLEFQKNRPAQNKSATMKPATATIRKTASVAALFLLLASTFLTLATANDSGNYELTLSNRSVKR